MSPPYERDIYHSQLSAHYPYYQRISGRLQRLKAVSPNILPQVKWSLDQPIKVKGFSKDNQCRRYPYCVGGLIAILCTYLICSIFPYPLHASCTVKWRFSEPCNHVIQRLKWQILKWSSCNNCGTQGSRFLYSLKDSANNNSITATHISPNFILSNDIRIIFAEGSEKNCIATGESKSNEWFIMFDYGSNYCNLRNLVEGAGYVTDHEFMELTTDSTCTQLNMVVCK